MKRKIAVEVICFLFILLFTYAGLNKLVEYEKFAIQVGQSPLLTAFGDWIPWVVIGVEFLLAGMLMIQRYRRVALYGCFSMMVMFTVYIVAILNLGSFIPCSCGGVLEKLGWTEHLIFNCFFLLLAFMGILLHVRDTSARANHKTTGITLSAVMVSSVTVVTALILFSGELRDKRGSFLRLFPSHPVLEKMSYDIKYNSYYLAGGTQHCIYLGNTSSPLHLLVVNTTKPDTQHVKLNIKGVMEQKFWSLQIAVDSPYFYAYDGAVPRIYKGNVSDWTAHRFAHNKEYFLDLVPMGHGSFFIKSLDAGTGESMLGKITPDSPYYRFDRTLLEKQVDGVFCTDGTMLFNQDLHRLIYLYRYRNEYLVMDTSLHKITGSHTIDTVSTVKIKVSGLTANNSYKMVTPPMLVNKGAATYQNWLFVHSALLAHNEHPKALDEASIIDVYDLNSGTYRFSFYIHDYMNAEKLRGFKVLDHQVMAIFDTHIQLYELNDEYFSGRNDITRVARKKGRTPV